MIYLDHGATSFPKPSRVPAGMVRALRTCANPGRGGHPPAQEAARVVYNCREQAAKLFSCRPEQVVFTSSCTQGLNTAIGSLFRPGSRVVVSGFEHNAVVRPLHALGVDIRVAGRQLFRWEDTLQDFDRALAQADGAVFTHCSNVFGYVLPVEELAKLCLAREIPFVIDAAQSAGVQPLDFAGLGADFIAMPGHKGLLGPQGTGILLCRDTAKPLIYGGTGSASILRTMPEDLPERLEAGTLNVPGIAGLGEGIGYVNQIGVDAIRCREQRQLLRAAGGLRQMGMEVFTGEHQGGTLSFRCRLDSEEAAAMLASRGIAVRAGLHCAPLAHESAGTLDTGTVRVSYGWNASDAQTDALLNSASGLTR